jgi:hypothetical protein
MFILSGDEYFCLGLNEMLSTFPPQKTDNLFVIDAGKSTLFFFDINTLTKNQYRDPLSALVSSQYITFTRNSTLDEFRHFISLISNKKNHRQTKKRLSKKENLIIRDIHAGFGMHAMQERHGMSNKTISNHKRNALRKLGIEMTPVLLTLLCLWEAFWKHFCVFQQVNRMASTKELTGVQTAVPDPWMIPARSEPYAPRDVHRPFLVSH